MNTLDSLISLLSAARDEAARIGAPAATIVSQLDEALAEARSLSAKDGRPDQGTRPEDLSSANDG